MEIIKNINFYFFLFFILFLTGGNTKINFAETQKSRRFLSSRNPQFRIDNLFNLSQNMRKNKGRSVKIAILDSGIDVEAVKAGIIRNVVEVRDFTEEGDSQDRLGHGTFMTGIISGNDPNCPGIAPEAELYILKVFDRNGGIFM